MNFLIKANNGKPDFGSEFNKSRFYEYLKEHEGKELKITPVEVKRTLTQNGYVHVLFHYLSQHTGHSEAEMKTIEKRRHLQPVEIEFLGQKHLVLPSTADLSNPKMSEFIERVLADCAELGIIVPTREELGYSPK